MEEQQNTQQLRAVIMAGGEGARLRPITCTMPKPLVPLLGKPAIHYCAELLRSHGITQITTTLHYLGQLIEQELGNGEQLGVRLTHSKTETPRGTAGSVRAAVKNAAATRTVVISGDTLTDCNLTEALRFHNERASKATIVLKKVDAPTEYGVALCDDNGRINRFLEKPTRSEVFSDLANTGIYILEPEIIEMIPEDRAFDFSLDLFPLLLQNDIPIFGYETHAYWCDIGDKQEYLRAQRDMLQGKVSFRCAATNNNGIYIESGAKIDDSAILHAPCYIQSGAEIEKRAVIDSFSVIGRGSRIGENASVKRSIIMDNVCVRQGAELRGAVICTGAVIEELSSVFEESVVAERARIGKKSVLYGTASVWPDKVIEENMRINENVVWGVTKRVICRDDGISGYIDTDISPETAVRIGASYASMLDTKSGAAISGDGSKRSAMLLGALASGAVSQGATVFTMPEMPFCVFSFAIRHMGLAGGVYIDASSDCARLTVCGRNGTAIDSRHRRKLEALFARGEHMPTGETGGVEFVSGAVKAYEEDILRRVRAQQIENVSLALDVPSGISSILLPILSQLGVNATLVSSEAGERMYSEMLSSSARLGIHIAKGSNQLSVMLHNGKTLYGASLIAVLAAAAVESGRHTEFVMPIVFPEEYSRYLMDKGASIENAPEEWHAWQREAYTHPNVPTELFDPIAAIVMLCQIESAGQTERLQAELPPSYVRERSFVCTFDDLGRVLRTVAEENARTIVSEVGGIKIRNDRGYVVIKASDDSSLCRLICGSFKEEYADELAGAFSEKLSSIISE